MQVSPYLFFNGNCADAFRFYEEVFGTPIDMMMPVEGSPAEGHMPPDWGDKILHASMKIGDTVLMASDAPPGRQAERMQGMSVSLELDDPDEAERVFNALGENGNITMPMAETFWARRFGMLVDRFGVPWMIGCT